MRSLALTCLLLVPGVPAAAQDGAELFRSKACMVCHDIGDDARDRVGPPLNGVVDRPLASVPGYNYSSALERGRDDGLTWNRDLLLRYLKRPSHAFPGTSMSFAGMKQRAEIEAVIDYLAGFAEDGSTVPR